jgi:hypothetical protein
LHLLSAVFNGLWALKSKVVEEEIGKQLVSLGQMDRFEAVEDAFNFQRDAETL